MNKYIYQPLSPGGKQTRLLVLLPDLPEARIRIQIVIVPFSTSKTPPYEALSYAWGKKVDPVKIIVEPSSFKLPRRRRGSSGYLKEKYVRAEANSLNKKREPSFTLDVWQNLASALKHVRLADQPRILWVDAICINQPDHEEKTKEVWRMGNIFRAARRVIVWLGPEASDSALALKTLSHLGQQVRMNWDDWQLWRAPGSKADWSKSSCILPYKEAQWRAITNMLSLEWFQRLWIWQEIHLARRAILVWGHCIMSWCHFRNGIACIQGNDTLGAHGVFSTPSFKETLRRVDHLVERPGKSSVIALLDRSRDSLCELPKDRIYAIMSIPSPSVHPNTTRIGPDYRKSDLEVYQQFALEHARHHSLEAIEFAHVPLRGLRDKNWPSWVPDWSCPSLYRRGLSGHAGGRIKPHFHHSAEDSTLIVPGVYCGTIKHVEDSIELNSSREDILAKIHSWEPSDLKFADYPSGGKLIDAFVATMISGGNASRRAGQADSTSSIQAGHRVLKYGGSDATSDPTEREWDLAYFRFIEQFLPGNSFFGTEDGHVGLAHPSTEPGDQIFVILGCNILKVLRPTISTNYGTCYSIIGTCYLHGFMNGEALLGKMPNTWDVRERRGVRDMRGLYFVNTVTGETSRMDPRLDSSCPGWTSRIDDYLGVVWKNEERGGDWSLYDPRFSVEALRARGVDIKDIMLI